MESAWKGTECGVIVADASDRQSERAISDAIHKEFRLHDRPDKRSLVLDGVIFKDSKFEPLIQLADMGAYIVHKHEKGDQKFAGWHTRRLQNT